MNNADREMVNSATSICYFHASSEIVESFVKKVSKKSGQKVDWGYSCGIADVFFIGSYNKVLAAILKFKPELDKICIEEAQRLYNIKISEAPVWRLFSPPPNQTYVQNIVSRMLRYYYNA